MDKAAYFDLTSLRNVDITRVDPNTLVDIRDTNVKTEVSLLERVWDYIFQVKNPYCFRYGKILVKIEHPETNITIEDCMEGYFRALCGTL